MCLLPAVADLQMFGSSVNGFGSPKSDLDLCLLHRGLNEVCVCVCELLWLTCCKRGKTLGGEET